MDNSVLKFSENSGIDGGIRSEISGDSSTVTGLKPSRLTVRSVEKVNTIINLKIAPERSKPISTQGMEKG